MAMQGGIQTFVDKYGIEQKRVYPLRVCCEEMAYDFPNHCFAQGEAVDIQLEVSYAEMDRSVVIDIDSGGRAYNPPGGVGQRHGRRHHQADRPENGLPVRSEP